MLQLADDITSGPLAKLTSSPLFTSLLESLRYCGEGVKRERGEGGGGGWSMWDLQCSCVICPPIPSIPYPPYPLCMSPTSLPFTIVTTFSLFSPHPPPLITHLLLTQLLLTHLLSSLTTSPHPPPLLTHTTSPHPPPLTPLLTHLHSHLLPHPPPLTPLLPTSTHTSPTHLHSHLSSSTYTHTSPHPPTPTPPPSPTCHPPPLTHLHLPTSMHTLLLTYLHAHTSPSTGPYRSSSVLANASHWVKRDPPSLPSHTHLLAAPNVAIYGQPCAERSDLSQQGRVESVGVAIINIFHGYLSCALLWSSFIRVA